MGDKKLSVEYTLVNVLVVNKSDQDVILNELFFEREMSYSVNLFIKK